MSLLRRGNDVVIVYPEHATTDEDGNTITRPSAVGVLARAVVQPLRQSDNAEDWDGGFLSESRYRLRLVGWHGGLLGAQSQVEWQGRRYAVHGDAKVHTGTARTARVDYVITCS